MGGSVRFADQVVATWLGSDFGHPSYWTVVLKQLIDRPELDVDLVGPILNYLRRRGSNDSGCQLQGRERDFAAFIWRVRQWMTRQANRPTPSWPHANFGGFRYTERNGDPWSVREWTIRQILDGDALVEEGRAMHHCVACYATACQRGYTTIWSMRSEDFLESRRQLTIEVEPTSRRIITALGKRNARPTLEARQVVDAWAQWAGLTISEWV